MDGREQTGTARQNSPLPNSALRGGSQLRYHCPVVDEGEIRQAFTDPVLRHGEWWCWKEDGTPLRWNGDFGLWEEQSLPPPPPSDSATPQTVNQGSATNKRDVSEETPAEPFVKSSQWPSRIRKLLSIRVFFACFLGAAIVSYLLSLIWDPLGVVLFWPVFGGLLLMSILNDDAVLYCPFCRKRTKVGAEVCHHCGRHIKPPQTK